MKSDHYVWFIWASSFLIPWLILFVSLPNFRWQILKISLLTAPFGLTEPLFVPAYWNPPSLFDLAQKTGFDIESIILSFALGGIGAALYNAVTRPGFLSISKNVIRLPAHRLHRTVLFLPFVVFIVAQFFPWNPIYAGILAMFSGALGTIICRPDLLRKTLLGGLIFLALYSIFLVGLEILSPGYVEKYWNWKAISGIRIFKFPIEEFLFAVSFGMYWSSVYEHLAWMEPIFIQKKHQLAGSRRFQSVI